MGVGLWLAAPAAEQLESGAELLREALAVNGIWLFTLNGFPYGDFHRARVKQAVYSPAWDRPERRHYTLNLARILSFCLAPWAECGTISTLPLGFGPNWSEGRQAQALAQLCCLAADLECLADRTGRPIRVCLEPEPGCVLESTADVLALFTRDLPAAARLARVSPQAIRTHLGLCYDCCHQAVLFEDPTESLAQLVAAEVPVGKVQVSSALQFDDSSRFDLDQTASDFAEPRYLHQVRTRVPAHSGRPVLYGRMDLPEALNDPRFPRTHPWRVHFHVPIHVMDLARPGVCTTRSAIQGVLDWLARSSGATPCIVPHLEVETYTWQVLPPELRPADSESLTACLTAELNWLESELERRGMLCSSTPHGYDSAEHAPAGESLERG
jgi:hypothetical protein